jgi:hypothetical protein
MKIAVSQTPAFPPSPLCLRGAGWPSLKRKLVWCESKRCDKDAIGWFWQLYKALANMSESTLACGIKIQFLLSLVDQCERRTMRSKFEYRRTGASLQTHCDAQSTQ